MTAELKKNLRTLLLDYCDNVYFQLASNETSFPLLIFDFPILQKIDINSYRGQLSIDVYDTNMDSLDRLADLLQDLDLTLINSENVSVNINLENIQYVEDKSNKTDNTILRKRLTYQIFIIFERSC